MRGKERQILDASAFHVPARTIQDGFAVMIIISTSDQEYARS